MIPDYQLLRRYAEGRDEAAFAELVRRHVDLVHSVALRRTTGDAHLAQDVTQTVFTDLARKARFLSGRTNLAGWLHTSARYAANSAVRGERRRRAREQEAATMNENNSADAANWEQLQPVLDESVGRLNETDRNAIILRFFEGKSHGEVGDLLGLSENAANKRIERALEKLRAHFARRGVVVSSTLLAAAISANSVQAAPAGLRANVAKAAVAGAGATTGSIFLQYLFMSTQVKIIAAIIILAIAAAIAVNWPHPAQPASAYMSRWASTENVPPAAADTPNPTGSSLSAPVAGPAVAAAIAPPSPASIAAMAAAAPTATNATVDASGFVAGPQTDLKTAIATGRHFLDGQDILSFLKTLMPPAALASEGQGSFEDVAAHINKDSHGAQQVASLLEALQSLDGLTPSLNDDQTRATYQLDPPVGGHKVVIFNKVNGFWYLDGM